METKILNISPEHISETEISIASEFLKQGKTVAFPTETVYGLGANALMPEAVKNIFKAKGRPSDNPLIVHIAKPEQAWEIAETVPLAAQNLMEQFWGGPLTIIMKKKSVIPDEVSAGLDTVGIRLPSHPVANALLSASGVFVAAPSANLSGKPSPTRAKHVLEDLNGRVDCIIDGGDATFGLESTVIDLSADLPLILRPGAVSLEEIRMVLPNAEYGSGGQVGAPKSPGMKYRHYAPNAPMILVENATDSFFQEQAKKEKIGVISYRGIGLHTEGAEVMDAGNDGFSYAARMFYLLRELNHRDVERIYAVMPEQTGIGAAVYNRMMKAAGENVITL